MSDVTQGLRRIAQSPAFKFILICFLIVLLLIPLFMVVGLVWERESRANEVKSEVARTWGDMQQLSGPYLVVPYTVRSETKEGEKRIEIVLQRHAVFLPDELTISGNGKSDVLHRSIFDVSVYTAKLALDGRFAAPDMRDVDTAATSVHWREAVLVLALSDVSGLKEASTVKLNGGQEIAFAPSVGVPGASLNGIHVPLGALGDGQPDDAPIGSFTFHTDLVFSGSQTLSFAPAARETAVKLTSDWPHPSFMGAFLPVERTITDAGFSAEWRVPHLARSVPSAWALSGEQGLNPFSGSMFGVTFYEPLEFYDLVNRAVKYGVLFLSLAFMAVFVLEILSGKRVHAVQYLFVGIAMVFFYVLLLSLSEHLGFAPAYLAASTATGGMLSLYVGKVLASRTQGLIMLGLFLVTYAFLYMILRLEDYALLAGALLGFAALTTVMFATLRVNWSEARPGGPTPAK